MRVYDHIQLMIIEESVRELLLKDGEVVIARSSTGILVQVPGVCIEKYVNRVLIFQPCVNSYDMYPTVMQFRTLAHDWIQE